MQEGGRSLVGERVEEGGRGRGWQVDHLCERVGCMCMCVYACVYLCVYLCVCMRVCVCVCVCVALACKRVCVIS